MNKNFNFDDNERFNIVVENISEKTNIYLYLRQHKFSEHFVSNLRKKENAILVNGKTANTKTTLKNGDNLSILKEPNNLTAIQLVDKDLDIVFEDENYLLVNKPPLLATMPTKSHYGDNLAGRIMHHLNGKITLRVFNRLDREASGLVLVSKHAIAHQFTRISQKEYYAICHNIMKDITTVEKPILTLQTNGINERKRIVSPLGQYAKTVFTPLKVVSNKTLVKAEITKGRTHQIRLHASSILHQLLGDQIYGVKDGYSRAFLHLKSITFENTLNGKTYHFEVDFPDDFKKVLYEKRP